MRTLTVANHKGGCAKSTTTRTLGAVLARDHGRATLLTDVDPQASLSSACGVRAEQGLGEVLGPDGLLLSDVIVPVADRLDLVPATSYLADVQLGITARKGRENLLRRALATVAERYDVALVDTPPSLGLLTFAALVAADAVLVPVVPQLLDLQGLALFMTTLADVGSVPLLGVLPVFFDRRLIHHREALDSMREQGLPVLDVTVGRSIKVAEAAVLGQDITAYDPHNPRAAEYRALGEVIDQWLNAHT